jgi:hypothetical protein
VAPYNGGSTITSYTIEVRQSDGLTFSEYLATCDGSGSAIVSGLECTILVSVLRAAPYSLSWGDLIYARVAATNIKGISEYSGASSGVAMLTVPDTPFYL